MKMILCAPKTKLKQLYTINIVISEVHLQLVAVWTELKFFKSKTLTNYTLTETTLSRIFLATTKVAVPLMIEYSIQIAPWISIKPIRELNNLWAFLRKPQLIAKAWHWLFRVLVSIIQPLTNNKTNTLLETIILLIRIYKHRFPPVLLQTPKSAGFMTSLTVWLVRWLPIQMVLRLFMSGPINMSSTTRLLQHSRSAELTISSSQQINSGFTRFT